jgi:hypothetical protein
MRFHELIQRSIGTRDKTFEKIRALKGRYNTLNPIYTYSCHDGRGKKQDKGSREVHDEGFGKQFGQELFCVLICALISKLVHLRFVSVSKCCPWEFAVIVES